MSIGRWVAPLLLMPPMPEKGEAMSQELSNLDLDRWFRTDPRYAGTFPNDKLPPLEPGHAYIVNLENAYKNGRPSPGTHWVGVIYQPSRVLYFDPFGVGPTQFVTRRIKETGKPLVINKLQFQGLDQSDCGILVAYVIKRMLDGASWKEVVGGELRPGMFVANDRTATKSWIRGD